MGRFGNWKLPTPTPPPPIWRTIYAGIVCLAQRSIATAARFWLVLN
jgi:hypothetical protein